MINKDTKDKCRILKKTKHSKVYLQECVHTQTEINRDRKTDTARETEGKAEKAHFPYIIMETQDTQMRNNFCDKKEWNVSCHMSISGGF